MEMFFYGVIALVVVAVGVVCIYVLMELRATLRLSRDFIKIMEQKLNPTLEESYHVLKSLRSIADGMKNMTEDIKAFSGQARELGECLKGLNMFVDSITRSTAVHVSAFKVGIKAAFDVLKRGFLKK